MKRTILVIGLALSLGGCYQPPLTLWKVTLESGETIDEVARKYYLGDGCVTFYDHGRTNMYCGVKSIRRMPTDDKEAK